MLEMYLDKSPIYIIKNAEFGGGVPSCRRPTGVRGHSPQVLQQFYSLSSKKYAFLSKFWQWRNKEGKASGDTGLRGAPAYFLQPFKNEFFQK